MSGGQICGKLKAKGVKHMSKLRYVWCGDYLIPDLTLNAKDYPPLGKYGRMRERYLRERRPVLCNAMLLGGRLDEHLHEIDDAAQKENGDIDAANGRCGWNHRRTEGARSDALGGRNERDQSPGGRNDF